MEQRNSESVLESASFSFSESTMYAINETPRPLQLPTFNEQSHLLGKGSHSHQGMPTARAFFSVVSTMAGAGVLGLPYAVNQSGWTGLILLLTTCLMANYTGLILVKSMSSSESGETLSTYHSLGQAAFGKIGHRVTLFIQNATLISAGTLFLILSGLNLQSFFDHWNWWNPISLKYYIIVTALLVWPFVIGLKTMKEISFIAIFGMFATTFTVIVICILSIIDHPSSSEVSHKLINLESFPFAFVTFVFAFSGHNVFPAVRDSMKHPEDYSKMQNIAFLTILALYLPPCIFGYAVFGDKAQSPILGNLKAGVVSSIATISITFHLWCTIPILGNPVNLWIEDVLEINGHQKEVLFRTGTRTALLAFQTGIAVLVPHFDDVMAIIGASFVSATVFFLPCLIYLKLNWKRVSNLEIVWICIVLFVGLLGSSIGLYSASIQLYEDTFGHILHLKEYIFYTVVTISTAIGGFVVGISLWLIRNSHQ